MKNSNISLLPCPVCRSTAIRPRKNDADITLFYECDTCGHEGPDADDGKCETIEEVEQRGVEVWNQHTTSAETL